MGLGIDPVVFLAGVVVAATPLLFAALGELVVEKSGVLNLGVEGMMIMGAVTGFAVGVSSASPATSFLAAAAAGAVLALLFGLLTQILLSNQVATGLALTLFGLGLAALIGQPYTGLRSPTMPRIHVEGVSDLPVVGRLHFNYDPVVCYLGLFLALIVWGFLARTRAGLILRAVGENHSAAHSLGYPSGSSCAAAAPARSDAAAARAVVSPMEVSVSGLAGGVKGPPEARRRGGARPPQIGGDRHQDDDGDKVGQHRKVEGRHRDAARLKVQLEDGDPAEEPCAKDGAAGSPGGEDDDDERDPLCPGRHALRPLRHPHQAEISVPHARAGPAESDGEEPEVAKIRSWPACAIWRMTRSASAPSEPLST
jgi:branched-subunit amino acid ABC-type transport system permease component